MNSKKFQKEFNEIPNYLSLLSYDLVGLIYYLSIKNELTEIDKLFKKENSLKVRLEYLILKIIKLIIG